MYRRKVVFLTMIQILMFGLFSQLQAYDHTYQNEDDISNSGPYTIQIEDQIRITGDCVVAATFTVPSGVEFYFGDDATLTVESGVTFTANGILFTSDEATPSAGDWGSIFFEGNSSSNAIGELTYCTFEYGGDEETVSLTASGPIVLDSYADVTILNCTIKDSYGSAIGVNESYNEFEIRFNKIYNCHKGVSIYDNNSDLTVNDSLFVRNNKLFDINDAGNALDGNAIVVSTLEDSTDSSDHLILIRNNEIFQCESNGIYTMIDNCEISNNVIANAGSNGIHVNFGYEVLEPFITSNIIYDYQSHGFSLIL